MLRKYGEVFARHGAITWESKLSGLYGLGLATLSSLPHTSTMASNYLAVLAQQTEVVGVFVGMLPLQPDIFV